MRIALGADALHTNAGLLRAYEPFALYVVAYLDGFYLVRVARPGYGICQCGKLTGTGELVLRRYHAVSERSLVLANHGARGWGVIDLLDLRARPARSALRDALPAYCPAI
jgi:hypothetical protein